MEVFGTEQNDQKKSDLSEEESKNNNVNTQYPDNNNTFWEALSIVEVLP